MWGHVCECQNARKLFTDKMFTRTMRDQEITTHKQNRFWHFGTIKKIVVS